MKLEYFENLLIIQALDRKVGEWRDEISQNDQRIEMLDRQVTQKSEERQKLQEEVKEFRSTIARLEKDLAKIDSTLEQNSEHLNQTSSQKEVEACEKEAANLQKDKEQAEKELLVTMEAQEKAERDLKSAIEFLTGIDDSKKEILSEVKRDNEVLQKKIDDQLERLKNMMGLLPKDFQDTFRNVNRNHRFKNPVVYIDGGKCGFCKFQITSSIASQVEASEVLERCGSCGRILVPSKARA